VRSSCASGGDAETERQAYATADAFIAAWQQRDRDGLSEHATSFRVVGNALSYTLAPDPDPLCRYYEDQPRLYCWVRVQETDAGVGFPVEIGTLVPGEPLPWKVDGVAPDVG
jgi:hypothetical protein